jgi:ABC-type polysaccharide/polyol phosphate transport system ATPase subunit
MICAAVFAGAPSLHLGSAARGRTGLASGPSLTMVAIVAPPSTIGDPHHPITREAFSDIRTCMHDLEFNHVSKRYRVRADRSAAPDSGNVLTRTLHRLRPRSEEFWALRDVSIQVNRGEALGIIGHNGAGKSTILKLIANITVPTEGEIRINGRLSALIEVGSGFHPELSGRENVYLSGSIMGMRRREIDAKLDSIVDFAGVRQFIDTPVKRYSSGMYVRLGFAIAAHLDPEILLLDEVLAVGDAAFQAKCMRRIKELEEAGTTIVFISHDLTAVERLCQRVVLMRHGRIAAEGRSRDVIRDYHQGAVAPTKSSALHTAASRRAACACAPPRDRRQARSTSVARSASRSSTTCSTRGTCSSRTTTS